MKLIVEGFRVLDFVPDGSNEPVRGVKVFAAFPSAGVEGRETASYFCREGEIELPEPLIVGQVYDADFSPKGKLLGLTEV